MQATMSSTTLPFSLSKPRIKPAGLLVTTEAMVAELPKEPAPAMPGGGGMSGMGGMM